VPCVAPPRLRGRPVCEKQLTPTKRGRRSPPSAQRRPTTAYLRVAPATGALDGDRRGRFLATRPTSPSERTRPAASAKRNKILKDERRPRFSPSLCHKNENFQTPISCGKLHLAHRTLLLTTSHECADTAQRSAISIFFHMGDDANMPGHARPSLPGNEPVRPHHPLPPHYKRRPQNRLIIISSATIQATTWMLISTLY